MIAGVCMAKDEADVIEATVGHMLSQVDRVYVSDNGSRDGTRDLLYDMSDVVVLEDPNPAYYQSRKTSALAEMARDEGAEWVVPFDADEVWLPRRHATLREALQSVDDEVMVVEADLFDYVATARDDLAFPPIERMKWRRGYAAPLPKVAVRATEGVTIHQGNHGADIPGQPIPLRLNGLLQISHFPYRSPEQMVRKARNGAAAYAATHLDESVGAHWRQFGRLSDEQIRDVFFKWYWRSDPERPLEIDGEQQPPLVFDPVTVCTPQPL